MRFFYKDHAVRILLYLKRAAIRKVQSEHEGELIRGNLNNKFAQHKNFAFNRGN